MLEALKFSCRESLEIDPKILFDEFLKVENWDDFNGFLFLPGIKRAKFITQTKDLTGSIIKVENMDDSFHHETIIEWVVDKKIVIEFNQFSKPLSHLASHFIEVWEVRKVQDIEFLHRSFELYLVSRLKKILFGLSLNFLKLQFVVTQKK